MKKHALFVALGLGLFLPSLAGAQDAVPAPAPPPAVAAPAPDCAAKATEKKLAGAALNSFLKKCERDAAMSACQAAAAEKKLVGAARMSFTKKCVKDAASAQAPEQKPQ
ncbi:hypothetical protein ACNHKD_13040 [Methylocystis sp. JAN1]|uniref:hypothetical protein n=1 Tax=Methylocystis sp. JAN1 TaxID=3397211 RepID=UPI003FA2E26D